MNIDPNCQSCKMPVCSKDFLHSLGFVPNLPLIVTQRAGMPATLSNDRNYISIRFTAYHLSTGNLKLSIVQRYNLYSTDRQR